MIPRLYDAIFEEHRERYRQMAFVTGPRQVGKTTTCRAQASSYLNWDNLDHRRVLLAGPAAIADYLRLSELRGRAATCTLDELHKYRRWRTLLKGFFDTYGERVRCIVTGSSHLDVFRRAGESLMGRYFHYRMHPLSIGELLRQDLPQTEVRDPKRLSEAKFAALWDHGGYPEPFLKRDRRFSTRWHGLRAQQMLREDVRDLTRVHELAQIEQLGLLLSERSGQSLVLSNVANDVQVSVDTARRWVGALCALHWGFLVRPWWRSVSKALRKEPKWYLHDWSACEDSGSRAETFVACHLLKAVEGWQDLGLGTFELRYLRDKMKREVDFVVVRDRKPWFLVEVKLSDRALSPALAHFQRQVGARHAFQVVIDMPYVDADCFAQGAIPLAVPARTFLSQLL
jgi:predicted AAA+ superfamily ATPase